MMIFENHWESAESHWPPLGVPGHFGGFLHAGAPPIWHFELRTLRSQGQDLRMSFCSTPAQEKCSVCLDGLEQALVWVGSPVRPDNLNPFQDSSPFHHRPWAHGIKGPTGPTGSIKGPTGPSPNSTTTTTTTTLYRALWDLIGAL